MWEHQELLFVCRYGLGTCIWVYAPFYTSNLINGHLLVGLGFLLVGSEFLPCRIACRGAATGGGGGYGGGIYPPTFLGQSVIFYFTR